MSVEDTELEQIELLQSICVGRATGSREDYDQQYKRIRHIVASEPSLNRLAPSFIKSCLDTTQFWSFISGKFGTYRERRQFIYAEFVPLLNRLRGASSALVEESVTDRLMEFSVEGVGVVWRIALDRLQSDPEGAITLARTLIETVCKHILDDRNAEYPRNCELSDLWKRTARELNLAAEQHSEQVFRQILGGCATVVNGMASVRNQLGDAHGKGRVPVRPSARHATLVVNLAGSLALFVIETDEAARVNDR